MFEKIKKWTEISHQIVFEKYGRKIDKIVFRLPNGKEKDFYIKKEGPAVSIVALTKDKKIILVRQFRPGPREILNELPGGYVDDNEKPEEAAARELFEETGYQGKIKLIGRAYDCAYSTMNRYCVIATDCELVANQKFDDAEFMEVVLLSIDDFRKLLRNGAMTDIEVGYIGLDYLNLL